MPAIKIYTDENVDPAIADGLRRRGVNAWAAKEVGNAGLTDEEQLEYAVKENAILFTHDTDLLVITGRWKQQDKEHWGLIYGHQEILGIGECVRRLKDYVDILRAEDMKNRVEYL